MVRSGNAEITVERYGPGASEGLRLSRSSAGVPSCRETAVHRAACIAAPGGLHRARHRGREGRRGERCPQGRHRRRAVRCRHGPVSRGGREAAALARQFTPDVTELYSPNATWPAVKAALQGASVVIYMGHGNGWPSRYRDSLYPAHPERLRPQPEAGGDDYTPPVLRRGPPSPRASSSPTNAVVLLHHLCYASGQHGARRPRRARSTRRASASTTSRPASSRPGHPRSSPRRTRVRRLHRSARSWVAALHRLDLARRPDRATATRSPSRAGAARATSPRWTPSAARPASRAASCSRRASPPPTSSVGPGATPTPTPAAASWASFRPSRASWPPASRPRSRRWPPRPRRPPSSTRSRTRSRDRGNLPKTFMASVRWDPLDGTPPDPTAEAAATDPRG